MRNARAGLLVAIIVLLGLSACSPATFAPESTRDEIKNEETAQENLVLDRLSQEEQTIYDIGYPILEANTPLCKNTVWTIGAEFWTRDSLGREYRKIAKTKYGLTDRLRIKHLYDGLPAQQAGLQFGDVLVSVNDKKIRSGSRGFDRLEDTLKDTPSHDVSITVERDGQELTKAVHMHEICDYVFGYDDEDQSVNAFSNGRAIMISRGMLRFVNTEQEMALVMSHELAHNVMLHGDKKRANVAIGQLAGSLLDGIRQDNRFKIAGAGLGAEAYSEAFETEADYVGMYFLERAGYSLDGVEDFHRRMSAEHAPDHIKDGGDHPSNAARYLAIAKARQEIESKKANGLPLIPEFSHIDSKETYLKISEVK